jgi:hypothetical protein
VDCGVGLDSLLQLVLGLDELRCLGGQLARVAARDDAEVDVLVGTEG